MVVAPAISCTFVNQGPVPGFEFSTSFFTRSSCILPNPESWILGSLDPWFPLGVHYIRLLVFHHSRPYPELTITSGVRYGSLVLPDPFISRNRILDVHTSTKIIRFSYVVQQYFPIRYVRVAGCFANITGRRHRPRANAQ